MARALALSETLNHIMETLGITSHELAGAVGASDKTVARWLADETYPQHGSRDKLAELVALTNLLVDSWVDNESLQLWFHGENRYLGGVRPVEALASGRIDRVDAAMEIILSGIFT